MTGDMSVCLWAAVRSLAAGGALGCFFGLRGFTIPGAATLRAGGRWARAGGAGSRICVAGGADAAGGRGVALIGAGTVSVALVSRWTGHANPTAARMTAAEIRIESRSPRRRFRIGLVSEGPDVKQIHFFGQCF